MNLLYIVVCDALKGEFEQTTQPPRYLRIFEESKSWNFVYGCPTISTQKLYSEDRAIGVPIPWTKQLRRGTVVGVFDCDNFVHMSNYFEFREFMETWRERNGQERRHA